MWLDDWPSLGSLDGSRMYRHGNNPWTAAFSALVEEVALFFFISAPPYISLLDTANYYCNSDKNDGFSGTI